jgi:hypothetical protein
VTNVDGYRVEPLTPDTWPAFADLAERHNGVFGGCWCVWFHCHPDPPEHREIGNRAFKRLMVGEGRAHAALVFDCDEAIAWAEYGTVDEPPNIHHRKEWEQTVEQVPDFRITCLFVDRRYSEDVLESLQLIRIRAVLTHFAVCRHVPGERDACRAAVADAATRVEGSAAGPGSVAAAPRAQQYSSIRSKRRHSASRNSAATKSVDLRGPVSGRGDRVPSAPTVPRVPQEGRPWPPPDSRARPGRRPAG